MFGGQVPKAGVWALCCTGRPRRGLEQRSGCSMRQAGVECAVLLRGALLPELWRCSA